MEGKYPISKLRKFISSYNKKVKSGEKHVYLPKVWKASRATLEKFVKDAFHVNDESNANHHRHRCRAKNDVHTETLSHPKRRQARQAADRWRRAVPAGRQACD